MRELVGRLTALDPDASESLKVVAYFDELVAGGVGLAGMLRGAAFLSGTTAGADVDGHVMRMVADGPAPGPVAEGTWPQRHAAAGRVWLERVGPAHTNDDMVLERICLALDVLAARRDSPPSSAAAVAIDGTHSIAERVAALSRVHLVASARTRLVVLPPELTATDTTSTLLPSEHGLLRVAIDAIGGDRVTRAGIGVWGRADHLPDSLPGAIAAYLLTTDRAPVVDAEDLGSLLPLLLRSADPENPGDDVVALRALSEHDLMIVDALVEHESIRAAASQLGLHHSTVAARHLAIGRCLGWDPRTALGRTRYTMARMQMMLIAR